MSCQIDLRGQRFGLLTVATDAVAEYRPYDAAKPRLGGPAYWPCICDCGATITVIGKQLRGGRIVSCLSNSCRVKGLIATGRTLPRQLGLHIPPIGKKFGRLTVIGATSSSEHGGKRRWLFKCDCGTTKEQFAAKVARGDIQSCGCLMREAVSAANTRYTDHLLKYKHSIIGKYKSHSKRKNRAFELTNEEFFSLMAQPCAYCGIVQGSTRRGRYGDVQYNGIDRVDVALGYIAENCVPCCKICNVMKQSLSVNEFLAHIEKIQNHMKRGR